MKCIRHFRGGIPLDRIRAPARIRVERPSLVSLSGDVYFGPNFSIMNRGEINIGDNVIFGPNVCIIDYNHNYKSSDFIPYSEENIVKPVKIGAHVWIGYGALILPGVTIGDGAIIGAGSVVVRDVPDCGIVAGNPAVLVSKRSATTFLTLKNKCNSHYLKVKN